MNGNCVVAKLLFLISVYEFPLSLECYLYNYYFLIFFFIIIIKILRVRSLPSLA